MLFRARVHIIYTFIFAVAMAMPLTVSSQQHDGNTKWEQLDTAAEPSPTDIGRNEGGNVRVQDMYIYIELETPAAVKLFTILGQPVSQMQLPAGTSRFRVSARGIYILKIGSTTRRITI